MPGLDEILRSRLLFSYSFLRAYTAPGEEASIGPELLKTIRDWQKNRKTDSPIDILESYLKPVLQTLELELDPRMDGNLDAFPVRPAWGDDKPVALLVVASFGDALDALEPGSGQWIVRAVNAARGYSDADLFDNPGLRWVILTNSTHWRLLDAYALRRYEAFVEFDVDALARKAQEYPDLAHLFQRCFSREAFIIDEDGQTGLERLLQASEESTEEVEKYLKISVSDDLEIPGDSDGILAQFCLGIVKATGQESFSEDERDAIYLDAIHLLYRLLFILYAEAWNLLPCENESYSQRSLSRILDKVEDDHRNGISDPSSTSIWDQMKWHFDVLDVGDDDLGIPAYNGGLFRTEDKPYLQKLEITDLYLSRALFLLGYMPKQPSSTGDYEYERIDFRDLSVRQLGSLYEGMIEYKLFIAEEEMYARRDERGDLIFLSANEDEKKPTDQVIKVGEIYFAQSPGERRATGTHYTPEVFVDKLIRRTLLPSVEERKSDILPKYDAWIEEIQISLDHKRDQLQRFVESELAGFIKRSYLSLRIADISMGSGHFLVNAAHQLTNSIIELISMPPWDLQDSELDPRHWRRQVVERCLYGVDIKPMAVELAKLSLWLISMSPGKPLSFLDHHLKVGDSLVGANIEDLAKYAPNSGLIPSESKVQEAVDAGQYLLASLEDSNPLLVSAKMLSHVSALPSNSIADVKGKGIDYERSSDLMAPYRLWADLICARELGAPISCDQLFDIGERISKGDFTQIHDMGEEFLREMPSNMRGYFHWELEFADVFVFGLDNEALYKSDRGFHIIIGNPPYLGGGKIRGGLGFQYSKYLKNRFIGSVGQTDLCAYFLRKSYNLANSSGRIGLVATNTIAQGDTRGSGLAVVIERGGRISFAERFVNWPGDATVEVNLIVIDKAIEELQKKADPDVYKPLLDGNEVDYISSRLDDFPEGPVFSLRQNENKAFMGDSLRGIGFVIDPEEAKTLFEDQLNREVLLPFQTGQDLNKDPSQEPARFVICFMDWTLSQAERYPELLEIVRKRVKPQRDKVREASDRNNWWQFARYRLEMRKSTQDIQKVLIRATVSDTHALVFGSKEVIYSHKVIIFAFNDYFHFALLQSSVHEKWMRRYTSTMRTDINYSVTDCFDTFPFPQGALTDSIKSAGDRGHEYYALRQNVMLSRELGLTKVYNLFHFLQNEDEDILQLRKLYTQMDKAILECYGWADIELDHDFRPNDREKIRFSISPSAKREILRRLIELNHVIAKKELLENEPR